MAVGVSFRLFGYKAKARADVRKRNRGRVMRERRNAARSRAVRRMTAEQDTT